MDDGADDYFDDVDEEQADVRLNALDAAADRRRLRCGRANSTSTVKLAHTMSHPNQAVAIGVIASRLQARIAAQHKQQQQHLIPSADPRRDLTCFDDPGLRAPHHADIFGEGCFDSDSDADSGDDCSRPEDDDDYEEEKSDENNQNPALVQLQYFHRGDKENTSFDSSAVVRKASSSRSALQEFSPAEKLELETSFRSSGKCRRECSSAMTPLPSPPAIAPPSVQTVREFLATVFVTAECSEECTIIALVYAERLILAGAAGTLTPFNWKPLVLTALLLASKVWDDLSMVNEDFSVFTPYTLEQINAWEVDALTILRFSVRVSAAEYAREYFSIREQAHRVRAEALPDVEVDMNRAQMLEALTAVMERRLRLMRPDVLDALVSGDALGHGTPRARRALSDSGARPAPSSATRLVLD